MHERLTCCRYLLLVGQNKSYPTITTAAPKTRGKTPPPPDLGELFSEKLLANWCLLIAPLEIDRENLENMTQSTDKIKMWLWVEWKHFHFFESFFFFFGALVPYLLEISSFILIITLRMLIRPKRTMNVSFHFCFLGVCIGQSGNQLHSVPKKSKF